MKKTISAILAFLLCLSLLTACTDDSGGNGGSASSNTPANYGLNEPAELKTIKVTALEVQKSAGTDFFEPGEGNQFIGVKFEIENISDEEQTMSSLLLFEAYADDVKASYSFSANVVFGDGTLDGTIPAGKKLVGWYAIEASLETKTIELQVSSDWLSGKKATFVLALS